MISYTQLPVSLFSTGTIQAGQTSSFLLLSVAYSSFNDAHWYERMLALAFLVMAAGSWTHADELFHQSMKQQDEDDKQQPLADDDDY